MNKRKIVLVVSMIFLILLVGLFVYSTATAQASRSAVNKNITASNTNAEMSSTHFLIDWNVIGSGGGSTASTHFKIRGTLGQFGLGSSTSTHFDNHPGFWQTFIRKVFLPLITR